MTDTTDDGRTVESRIAGMVVTETPEVLALCHSRATTAFFIGCGTLAFTAIFVTPLYIVFQVLVYHFDEGMINGKPAALAH